MLTLEKPKPHHSGHVLVITNDSRHAGVIRVSLAGARFEWFEVEWVCTLSDGIDRLKRLEIVAVVLDLSLPDGHGMEAFDSVSMSAPGVPILILCGPEDEEAAK